MKRKKENTSLANMNKSKGKKLFFLVLPGLIYVFVFSYLPLWGWSLAFLDYKPGRIISDCTFVGLDNFKVMFGNPILRRNVFQSLKNTLGIHFLAYLWMPVNMFFAVFLSELRNKKFQKVVQTVSTLPHFISWVIIYALANSLFSRAGLLNTLLLDWGVIEKPLNILMTDKHVWITQVLLQGWKGTGWSAIVYFAAIAGIDQELYEAAMVDGAGKMRRIWHITLPHLMPTFFVLFIMSIGNLLSTGVDQYYVFANAMNQKYIEVFDLYVYNLGIGNGNISYGVAIGIMKSGIALLLFSMANYVSKKVRGAGIA